MLLWIPESIDDKEVLINHGNLLSNFVVHLDQQIVVRLSMMPRVK